MTARIVGVAGTESAPLDDGVVLFHGPTGKFVLLNRSAAFLWEALASPTTAEELADKLGGQFAAPVDTARADTEELVERLQELGLVTSAGDAPAT